jgi:hypothetical protein
MPTHAQEWSSRRNMGKGQLIFIRGLLDRLLRWCPFSLDEVTSINKVRIEIDIVLRRWNVESIECKDRFLVCTEERDEQLVRSED